MVISKYQSGAATILSNHAFVIFSMLLLSFTVSSEGNREDTNKPTPNSFTIDNLVTDNFVTDIEGIQISMLSPQFWKKKLKPHQSSILSHQQIAKQNNHLFKTNEHMNNLANYPSQLSGGEVIKMIAAISSIPTDNRYYSNSKLVSDQNYANYLIDLNLKNIPEKISIQYGMIVNRTNMRSFPTHDAVFKQPDNFNLDRFQETALFPTEAVVIIHESFDKKWFFVASYNYEAWVLKSDVAIGSYDDIFQYKNNNSFIVVTGDKVNTTYNPTNKAVSNIQLDMGIRLTLVKKENVPTSIDGQNTYASYVIKLPVKNSNGQLEFQLAMIARSKDVHLGYLPFTRQNIINQSFKFLGERYGWGHSFNARDCTGFVGDVYKSFGILMPRNSGQQAESSQGQNIHYSKSASITDKITDVKKLDVGDLIYIPGHVMMFLGLQNDKPFIIHDVSGLSYRKEDGSYYKSTLNGVSVTPLLPLQLNQETSYLDRIYNLKKIK